MRNLLTLAVMATLLCFGCSKENLEVKELPQNSDPLTKSEMNEHLESSIQKNGVFHWSTVDPHFIWSAGMQSDSIFGIGYQLESTNDIKDIIHTIDIESTDWKNIRQQIFEIVLEGEREIGAVEKIEDLLPFGYPEVLPNFLIKITNQKTVEKLLTLNIIRYVEPTGYSIPSMESSQQVSLRSGSGCNGGPSNNINQNDYNVLSPNVKRKP